MFDIFSKVEILIIILIIVLLFVLLYIHRKSALPTTDSPKLGVKELIQQVKTEIIELEKQRIQAKESPLLELKDFELEVNFVVKENGTQKGEFDFKVITVGNDSFFGTEKTQKITLRMSAIPSKEQTSPPSDMVIPTFNDETKNEDKK